MTPTRRGPITFTTMQDYEKLGVWRQAQRKMPFALLRRVREAIPSLHQPPTPTDQRPETIHGEPRTNDS